MTPASSQDTRSGGRRRLLSESLVNTPTVLFRSMRRRRSTGSLVSSDRANGYCDEEYHQLSGDVPGWGKIGTMGGGQDVRTCSECATLCSSIDACLSYQCSFEELRCKLNEVSEPTPGVSQYRDYFFCKKNGASSTVAKNIGTEAPPPPSSPPPEDSKLCRLRRSGYCRSYLNTRCSDWRDSAHLWRKSKQLSKLEDCMRQDCEMSLQPGSLRQPGEFVFMSKAQPCDGPDK